MEHLGTLVRELMSARSAVGWAKRKGDADAERAARDRVHAAKVALGERGPKDDVEHSRWRYSLMNWGHDPLK